MANPTAQANANIRAELARAEVSQAEVASLIGITPSQVSARLKDRVPWKLHEVQQLAAHLGVPVSALVDSPAADPASATATGSAVA